MTLLEAIDKRHSRRKYLSTPIQKDIAEKLETYANELSLLCGVRIEWAWNDGAAFAGFRKSYGMFSGVKNYAGLIADKDDVLAVERLGYYGELLNLYAVTLGLGTCWVGGSLDRNACPFELSGNETVICTIVMGYVAEPDSLKERMIRGAVHRKTKSISDMMKPAAVPDWFMAGMTAVLKAPSAVNRQPVMFSYSGGTARAEILKTGDFTLFIDLGIAKAHFELGSGCGKWAFGNSAEFSLF
ncbi:MAG: nitroreductase [Clostridiales bacterium]|nr:nitroreductase [Clostridiales bacterium]